MSERDNEAKRDYAFEALAEVTSTDWNAGRGELNKALKSIKEQSPEITDSYLLACEIHDRAKAYAQVMGDSILVTPSALAKHWLRVVEQAPKPAPSTPPPVVGGEVQGRCPECGGDRMVMLGDTDVAVPCPTCNSPTSTGSSPPPPPLPPVAALGAGGGPQDSWTLGEAKDWLRARLNEGEHCPCCTQMAKIYHWHMYRTAAVLLIKMYRAGGTEKFVETALFKGRGQGDVARLRQFGLAEREKDARPDGGKSGFSRVTPLGEDYVLGRATVPYTAVVFDNRVLRFEGDPKTISDALKESFDYRTYVHWETLE